MKASTSLRVVTLGLLVATLGLTGCMLDPLVEDEPGASVHVLPSGSNIPLVEVAPELVHQITVHDGLDDGPLEEAGGVVARKTGWAGGAAVNYWSFGPAPKVGAQLYVLVEDSDDGPVPIERHPYLLDSMPGDLGYSPFRRIQHVHVTARYDGELLTTLRALTDAIELGLVEEPVTTGTWMNAPVVPPGTTLDVGPDLDPATPIEAYAGGYQVQMFVFGGERGVQPLRNGAIPSVQAAQLREAGAVSLGSKPVFQLGIPLTAPTDAYNYTALVTLVEVNLADGIDDATLKADADLFTRSMTGSISGMTASVDWFVITTNTRNWPTQFDVGEP